MLGPEKCRHRDKYKHSLVALLQAVSLVGSDSILEISDTLKELIILERKDDDQVSSSSKSS